MTNTSSLNSPHAMRNHYESLIADLDRMILNATDAAYDDDMPLTNQNIARMISSDELESACSRIDSPFYSTNFLESSSAPFSDIMITDAIFTALITTRLNCTIRDICYYY